jgi:hypothetical protein
MRRLFVLSAIASIVFSLQVFSQENGVPPRIHPNTSGWPDLFNTDLSDAEYPIASWSFYKDVLYMNMGDCIWTRKEYKSFILDLEFKITRGANSGVILRCSDINRWIASSVEIQVADDFDKTMGEKWPTGSVYGHLLPKKDELKDTGEWNHYTITCKDQMIWVILNGEQVIQMDMSKWTGNAKNPDGSRIPSRLNIPLANLPLKGRIGLQGRFSGAIVYYRNIKIRELE